MKLQYIALDGVTRRWFDTRDISYEWPVEEEREKVPENEPDDEPIPGLDDLPPRDSGPLRYTLRRMEDRRWITDRLGTRREITESEGLRIVERIGASPPEDAPPKHKLPPLVCSERTLVELMGFKPPYPGFIKKLLKEGRITLGDPVHSRLHRIWFADLREHRKLLADLRENRKLQETLRRRNDVERT